MPGPCRTRAARDQAGIAAVDGYAWIRPEIDSGNLSKNETLVQLSDLRRYEMHLASLRENAKTLGNSAK
jgi:hypothetical protein